MAGIASDSGEAKAVGPRTKITLEAAVAICFFLVVPLTIFIWGMRSDLSEMKSAFTRVLDHIQKQEAIDAELNLKIALLQEQLKNVQTQIKERKQ